MKYMKAKELQEDKQEKFRLEYEEKQRMVEEKLKKLEQVKTTLQNTLN